MTNYIKALLPIEWVERIPEDSPPRGCVPSLAGQNRREQTGFRSGCLASARRLSLTPCAKPNPSSNLDNSIIIRREPMEEELPHYVPPGTGCAHGAPPESPRLESLPTADGKWTEFTHSIGRRSKRNFLFPDPDVPELMGAPFLRGDRPVEGPLLLHPHERDLSPFSPREQVDNFLEPSALRIAGLADPNRVKGHEPSPLS
jgi:hypothetical protein